MHTTLFVASFLCVSVLQLTADEPTRPQLSLDGQWQFRLDPQDEGVAGQWFAREATTDIISDRFAMGRADGRRGQCPRAAAGLPRPNRGGGVVLPGTGSRCCPAAGGGTAGSGHSP